MSAKKSNKKSSKSSEKALIKQKTTQNESYVITKSSVKKHDSNKLFDTPNRQFGPSHPKTHKLPTKLKSNTNQSTLSAQASASIFRDDLAEKIPRDEVSAHIQLITMIAPTTTPAGSYRRGAPFCNDIDVVIREPIEKVVNDLTSLGYIKHTFSAGNHKFSGIVKHPEFPRHRHLDIIMTTTQSYPFAMLYFTGSAKHNIILRVKAKRLGLRLNEHGLFRGDNLLPGISTEQDIFAALGLPYKDPRERI